MATKAFEQTYINETELCEPIDFYTRVNRPDLVEEGDVEYIVLDARPASECEQPPPDRPWTSAPYLAGLILPQGSSNCRYLPANITVVDATDYKQLAMGLAFAAKALYWPEVVLLSDTACSWSGAQLGFRSLMEAAAAEAGVTILANEHNASGTCLDVGIESHNIMLLSVQNPAQAAATLIHAWRRGWLTPGRALFYNSGVVYADPTLLAQLLVDKYGAEGVDVVERLDAISLYVGTYVGNSRAATNIENARAAYEQTGSPPVPSSAAETAVWQWTTNLRIRLTMAHCDSRFNPPIFDVGRELPYLFMTRLSEKGAAEVRGRFDPASKVWTFFDLQGNVTPDVELLIDNGDRFPLVQTPTVLPVAFVFDTPTTPELLAALDRMFNATGIVGKRHPHVTIQPRYFSGSANCSETAAAIVTDSSILAALAVVGTSCRSRLQDRVGPTHMPLLFWGQGLEDEMAAVGAAANAFVMMAPVRSALASLVLMLKDRGWSRPVLVTDFRLPAEILDALADVGLGRSVVYAPPVDADCAAVVERPVAEIGATRSPLIVLDVPPTNLPCLVRGLYTNGLVEPPYTYVLTARASRGLPLLTPAHRDALMPRALLMATDRGDPSESTLTALLHAEGFLRPDAAYTPLVAGMELSHVLLSAAERRLNTYGFGHSRTRSAAALVAGLESMHGANALQGLLPKFVVLDNRVTTALQHIAAVDPSGDITAFGAILTSGAFAVFSPSILNAVDLPTAADYEALREGGGSGGDSSAPKSSSSASSAQRWWIAVVVVGGVLAALGAAWCHFRKRRKAERDRRMQSLNTARTLLVGMRFHGRTLVPLPELERDNVHLRHTLRIGTFGQVYTAKVDSGALSEETDGRMVVAKLWQILGTQDNDEGALGPRSTAVDQLRLEALVLRQFTGEPHVAQVHGLLCNGPRHLGLVMEYFPLGTLAELLERETPPNETKLRMAREVASGMRAVNAAGALHMELAACHVMLTDDKRCKLAHIGLPNMQQRYYAIRLRSPNIRWCAPEVLRELAFSSQSDVWSFGVLLYEIATEGRMPFEGLDSVHVKAKVLEGGHVSMPLHCHAALHTAAKACFAKSPSARPTFALLEQQLADAEQRINDLIRMGETAASFSPVGVNGDVSVRGESPHELGPGIAVTSFGPLAVITPPLAQMPLLPHSSAALHYSRPLRSPVSSTASTAPAGSGIWSTDSGALTLDANHNLDLDVDTAGTRSTHPSPTTLAPNERASPPPPTTRRVTAATQRQQRKLDMPGVQDALVSSPRDLPQAHSRQAEASLVPCDNNARTVQFLV